MQCASTTAGSHTQPPPQVTRTLPMLEAQLSRYWRMSSTESPEAEAAAMAAVAMVAAVVRAAAAKVEAAAGAIVGR